MFNNWLRPVDINKIKSKSKRNFYNHISLFDENMLDVRETEIGIVAIDEIEVNAIRSELQHLDYPFSISIVDFGNFRKKDNSFIIPFLKELLESNIFPVIIGKNPLHAVAQILSYQKKINLAVADKTIPFDTKERGNRYYLNKIVKNANAHLSKISILGCQAHFIHQKAKDVFSTGRFECKGLGQIKTDVLDTEPIIRDADLFAFNIEVIKSHEAPGQKHPSPTGLTTEEACQLSYYAGLSEKLTSLGIYGYDKRYDKRNQTAQIIAQLIWYFISGFNDRQNDFPLSFHSMVEYIVEVKDLGYHLSFWKSKKTDRWWLQAPAQTNENITQLIPCAHRDYKMASKGNLTERLLQILDGY